ncbi:uncharacterized protein LOC135258697 isoform X2 [Anguilla rostrata]
MELLAPPLPGQRLLSFDEIVDREPAYMTSILAGCVSDCLGRYPAELGGGSWRMGADAEDAVGASEPGPAPGPGDSGKLPEHLHSSDLPGPTAALYYCPLLWPHRVHPVAPLKPLPVPLPLLPNPPVPYYPALSPQLALPLPGYPAQGRYSGFAQWQYYTPRPRSRDTPTYCSVLPEERRTSDPRERSQFREGSKVRHKATGCRSRSFSQLDSEGRRKGGEGQAVAERALSEYSHIMETLGSEVTGRSEVVEEERGKFTEYLNQLCQQKEFVTQVLALIDMRCVWSLLSPDTDPHTTHQRAEGSMEKRTCPGASLSPFSDLGLQCRTPTPKVHLEHLLNWTSPSLGFPSITGFQLYNHTSPPFKVHAHMRTHTHTHTHAHTHALTHSPTHTHSLSHTHTRTHTHTHAHTHTPSLPGPIPDRDCVKYGNV